MEEQSCYQSQKGDSNPLWRSNHVPLFVELLSACGVWEIVEWSRIIMYLILMNFYIF